MTDNDDHTRIGVANGRQGAGQESASPFGTAPPGAAHDDDRTLIMPSGGTAFGQTVPGVAPGGAQRTVRGQLPDHGAGFGTTHAPQRPGQYPMPLGSPAAGSPGGVTQIGPAPAGGFGGGDDTWLGGALPQPGGNPHYMANPPPNPRQQAYPYQQQPYHPQPAGYWPGQALHDRRPMGGDMADIGQANLADPGFFPHISQQQRQQAPMSGPRIPLMAALQVKGLGRGSATNPLIASAASLLILLGRLRTGLVEMQAAPLMDHVTREIDAFERNALMAGVNPHEALVAKYALSGTADDIVQNLPGADRGNWLQYSMVARFFHKRDSGVGFFQEVEKAMQAPGQHYDLLELMLTCLNLGFEGQFRTLPNGGVELARIRQAVYETLRRVRPRPDEDISPVWAPVEIGRRRRWRAIPLSILLGVGAFLIFLTFVGLSMWLNRDGVAIAADLRQVNAGRPTIAIARQTHVAPPPVVTSTQLERIRGQLAAEIEANQLEVIPRGDYIAIRVGNLQMFDFSSIELRPEFTPLATRIATVLNEEGGPILVQGHTDDVPVKPTSRFRSNDNLSLLRAEAVRDMLADGLIDDTGRMGVEGRGAAEPIAENATEEGRAQNRRVEILLQREGMGADTGPDAGHDVAPMDEQAEVAE